MLDAAAPNETITTLPVQVALDAERCAKRSFADDPTKSVNESNRRTNMRLAAGRISWVCATTGGQWRDVSHHELLESLHLDVATYKDAAARHKEESIALNRQRSGLFRTGASYKTAPFDAVPVITFPDIKLEKGLEHLVREGRLRKVGSGDTAMYGILPSFLDDLEIIPLPEEVHEP